METRCNNMNSCNNRCSRPNNHSVGNQPTYNYGRRNVPNQNRMDVECVCRVTPGKKCHTADPMTQLDDNFPPVMAYVPWQQWGELYDTDCALVQGTIFKDLNYIFCGVRC